MKIRFSGIIITYYNLLKHSWIFFFYQSDLNAACGKSKLDKNQANCQSIILDTANDIRHARLALIKLILKLLQTMRYKSTNRAQTESFTTVPLMESFNDMGDAPKWLCFYPQGFSLTILYFNFVRFYYTFAIQFR